MFDTSVRVTQWSKLAIFLYLIIDFIHIARMPLQSYPLSSLKLLILLISLFFSFFFVFHFFKIQSADIFDLLKDASTIFMKLH